MSLLDRAVSLMLPAVPKPLVRYFSRPYIAGSTMDDAFATVERLAEEGALATLDILGEFISTADEARRNTDAYLELIERIARDGHRHCNVSVKPTALGLLIDPDLCEENVRVLVRRAAEIGSFVRMDMEDSSCTSATLAIYGRLREEFPGAWAPSSRRCCAARWMMSTR